MSGPGPRYPMMVHDLLDLRTAKVGIELTNRCNMRCSMCPLHSLTRPTADMPWDLVEKVAADFKDNRIQVRWLHEMGEPLLYDRLAEAIDLFPGCSVSTNAMALDSVVGNRILESSLGRIRLCMDTLNSEVYPEIRRGGVFDKTVGNIRSFLDLSRGRSLRVEIQKMVTKLTASETVGDFEAFFSLSKYPQAAVIEKTCEGLDTTDATDLHEEFYGCFQGYPFRWFIVLADGRVTHCCYDSDGLQPIGDMRTQTVRQILASVAIPRYMQAFKARDWETLPRCGECHRNATGPAIVKDRLVQIGHKVERLLPVKQIGRRIFNRADDGGEPR